MKKHNKFKMMNGKLTGVTYHSVHLNMKWKIPCLNPNRHICGRSWEVWLMDERLVGLFNGKGF